MTSARIEAHALARYRAEFPVFETKVYLNSCSLGALSRRSRRRVMQFLDEWDRRGAAAWYDEWWAGLEALRRGYGELIGAGPGEIALHASVSTATAVLAGALDGGTRRKVVTTALDFPTVAYQWLAKRRTGVEVVVLESPDRVAIPLEAWERAVDERTALVATSHVFFTTGAIQDIRGVAEIAHRKGALCFIDAYQGVGQVPLDVREAGVDFLTAGGLKWLLGGPGIVFLYAREELARTLEPSVTGWFAHERPFAFDPREIVWHADARRLEQGTPSLAAVYAQLGGLELIGEIGVPRIRAVLEDLIDDLVARATAAGFEPRIAPMRADRSAIVMLPTAEPQAQVRRLADAGIVADARPGHVRLSPFFYNVTDDHAQAIEVLRA